ncbi:dATP/dGTP pyrophosphohydrolase domain-containing protein [Salmonella enterica]
MTTITREQQRQILIDTANHVISRDNTSPYSENLRELARIALAALNDEPVAYNQVQRDMMKDIIVRKLGGNLLGYKLMMADIHAVTMALIQAGFRTAPPASERERIRREHAEWSDATFGNVGPVGPLKHLSKEALEAAADPSDPLEWADMQFLLWDAQRRMGISDEFITRAMIEKLAINKTRQWPEPKDGEPRLHIKEQSAPVIPDGWISCSERMPEDEQEVIVHNKLGYRYVSYFDEHSGLFFDMRGGNQMNCIEHILVTYWMPLPAAPEPEQS